MSPPVVCAVIPAYRAEQSIAAVIEALPPFVGLVVVVDDCSSDRTADAARATRDPRLHVIRHTENQGVGGATWSGYQEAVRLGADIAVKVDADGQMDPAFLSTLLVPLLSHEADYVKANRFVHQRQLAAMPLLRRVGNTGLSFLTKVASGYWSVFDPTNGFTAIGTHVLKYLAPEAIARRYFFETSMLIELSLARAVVADVYIPARYGGEVSQLSEWQTLLTFPPRLVRGCLRRIWTQHFVRDFGLLAVFFVVGLLLATFGGTFGLWHWWHSARAGVATPTGTVMIATLSLILGVQCLLQAILLDVQSQPTVPLGRAEATDLRVLQSVQIPADPRTTARARDRNARQYATLRRMDPRQER